MTKFRVVATLDIELDTVNYHVPADLNLREQLIEDISEAIEEQLSVSVSEIRVNKIIPANEYDESDLT